MLPQDVPEKVDDLLVDESTSIAATDSFPSAVSVLEKLEGGLTAFPILELLTNMGMALRIDIAEECWLLGLAPEFPKRCEVLDFDFDFPTKTSSSAVPDHQVRRYFRFPDTRSGFIPGFFLRLFVYMVNREGYTLSDGYRYGNATKLFKRFNGKDGSDTSSIVSILLCELPSKDHDAFVVAVGAQGSQALELCTRELNVFRTFLYKTSKTSVSFREYCMLVHDDVDQCNIMVRELLLDDNVPLDEVEPALFGIPSLYDLNDNDNILHQDCMAARRNVIELYFGRSKHVGTRVDKKQAFSGPESKKEAILNHTSLRPIARTEFDVLQVKSSQSDCRAYWLDFYKLESAYTTELTERCVDIKVVPVPDICLEYAEACYDFPPLFSGNYKDMQSCISPEWRGEVNEVYVRELLYRHWKRHGGVESMTLSHFDELVDNCLQKNKVRSETDVELMMEDI